MDPVGLGQCSKLLVAAAFVISGTVPSLALYKDQATTQAHQTCERSFSPKNTDLPAPRNSRARELASACRWGTTYAHETIYEPYQTTGSTSKDYPIALPDLVEFREAYDQGLKRCETYNDQSRLQERMACMDGYDYLAADLVSRSEDYLKEAEPDALQRSFDDAYYKKMTYQNVYQNFVSSSTWAYVLADRVIFNPERYRFYRRDQAYAPEIPEDQKEAARAFAAAHASGATVHSNSGNSLFWYWYWSHYHSAWGSSYSPSPSYRRDTSARVGNLAADGPPAAYGPRAPARAFAPNSPWGSSTGAASATSAPVARAAAIPRSGPAERGGLGSYGGYSKAGDGARATIPSARTISGYSGRAGATLGGTYATAYGPARSIGAMGGRGSASVGSFATGHASSGGARGGGGGGGGHGGGGSGGG